MKSRTITLTADQQLLFMELLAASFEYKATKKLRSETAIKNMCGYYIDAVEKIQANNIPIADRRNNFFTWLKDQLSHSGQRIYNTEACQHALKLIQEFCNET